uniref:Uncharacterized protein n=1 Tax=Ceratitis capitata TaxID=7213 RepID=W8ASE6_CERCA
MHMGCARMCHAGRMHISTACHMPHAACHQITKTQFPMLITIASRCSNVQRVACNVPRIFLFFFLFLQKSNNKNRHNKQMRTTSLNNSRSMRQHFHEQYQENNELYRTSVSQLEARPNEQRPANQRYAKQID